MDNLELLYIIPLSVIILFFMIIMGVTLTSIATGNPGMGEEMLKTFFYRKNKKS